MATTTKKAAKSAAAPAKAEAEAAPIEFEYEGETYVITRANADNLEIFELVELDQLIRATRLFLGADQWDRWKDAQRDADGAVPVGKFTPFLNAVMAAIGGNY